jgi:predicted GNAT superfamily acetyltransferase
MTEAKITRLIRDIRKNRGEEETILGNNPEAYLQKLRRDPERIRRLLQEAGIYNKNGKLTRRYR